MTQKSRKKKLTKSQRKLRYYQRNYQRELQRCERIKNAIQTTQTFETQRSRIQVQYYRFVDWSYGGLILRIIGGIILIALIGNLLPADYQRKSAVGMWLIAAIALLVWWQQRKEKEANFEDMLQGFHEQIMNQHEFIY